MLIDNEESRGQKSIADDPEMKCDVHKHCMNNSDSQQEKVLKRKSKKQKRMVLSSMCVVQFIYILLNITYQMVVSFEFHNRCLH